MAHIVAFRTSRFDVSAETPNTINPIAGHRHRSISDKLFGRNKMAVDDPLAALIERMVRADGQISDVSIERET
jgi:hypothetical protein